jgi:hypothetical protein
MGADVVSRVYGKLAGEFFEALVGLSWELR